jgi:hypothetical protein
MGISLYQGCGLITGGKSVPVGKIFVMEFFYGVALNNQPNSPGVQYRFNFQNRFTFFPPPTVQSSVNIASSSNSVFQQVKSSFIHTGSNLHVFEFRNSTIGAAAVRARVSGYLIDAP